MSARISIIIPTYQHASTLVRCLDSILAQSRKADEIIVVDDGSTDNTQEVLRSYQTRRGLPFEALRSPQALEEGTPPVTVLVQTNQGAPTARNNGFKRSTGSLVLFCDADVLMRPNMLEELENALEMHPEVAYAYSGFQWGWKAFASFPFDADRLKHMNYIHTSALVRREAFPMFDPSLKRFQDWDLWLTMLERGSTGVYVRKILYRVLQEKRPIRMSTWLPSWMFRVPWRRIGWMPSRVRSYEAAQNLIKTKHHLL